MNQLKIYIDRLKQDHTLKFDEALPPDFMQIEEEELAFKEPIHIQGEAYLADDHLIIHLNVEAIATLPCSVCNQPASTPIQIKNLYLTKPLIEIKGAVFDLVQEIRETILLQTPLFAECSQGQCPEREEIKRFFKKEEPSQPKNQTNNFPFADLK